MQGEIDRGEIIEATQPEATGAPHWLRALLMAAIFLCFFVGSPIIALVLFPILRLRSSSEESYRRRCTYLLYRGMRGIIRTARFLGLVEFDDLELPASVARGPFVLISNHPTFIDMLLILGSVPHLTCITAGRWSRHWALGRLLRSTTYLPGPGSGLPQSEDMLASIVAHLREGHALLIFPEGQRSRADGLRRFRRGAVEAAIAADVPIVPLFLAIDRPYLTKEVGLWDPPSPPPRYRFDRFEVVEPHSEAFGGDAGRIRRHLDALYKARFEEQLALQRALSAGDPPPALPRAQAPELGEGPPRSRRS